MDELDASVGVVVALAGMFFFWMFKAYGEYKRVMRLYFAVPVIAIGVMIVAVRAAQ